MNTAGRCTNPCLCATGLTTHPFAPKRSGLASVMYWYRPPPATTTGLRLYAPSITSPSVPLHLELLAPMKTFCEAVPIRHEHQLAYACSRHLCAAISPPVCIVHQYENTVGGCTHQARAPASLYELQLACAHHLSPGPCTKTLVL